MAHRNNSKEEDPEVEAAVDRSFADHKEIALS
jgi:hypothetical protein